MWQRLVQCTAVLISLSPASPQLNGDPADVPVLRAQKNEVLRGQFLSLQCTVNHSTAGGLIWSFLYHNGVKISRRDSSTGSVSYTEAALLRSSGVYSCSYGNAQGESPRSNAIFINVTSSIPGVPAAGPTFRIQSVPGVLTASVPQYEAPPLYYTVYLGGKKYAESSISRIYLPHGISGNYTVSASSYGGVSNSTDPINVTFYDSPVVTPQSLGPPVVNRSYTLTCSHAVPVGVVVNWYHFLGYVVAGNTSSIQTVVRADPVEYRFRCGVQYGADTLLSSDLFLYSTKPKKPTISILQSSRFPSSTNESTLLLTCDSGYNFVVSWFRDGVKVTGLSKSYGQARVTRLPGPGAYYTCTHTNSLGESERSDPVYVPGWDEIIMSASSPVACSGQRLTLSCNAKVQVPNIKYSWEIYRRNSSSSVDTLSDQTLQFLSLNSSDQGLYFCVVDIGGHSFYANKHYVIAFDVPEPPQLTAYFAVEPPNKVTVKLMCSVQSLIMDVSEPFRVYKNGVAVTTLPSSGSQFYLADMLSLTEFYTLDLADLYIEGNYSCTSVNTAGESAHSNVIFISRSAGAYPAYPPTIQANDSFPALRKSITLTCQAPSFIADHQIAWRKDFVPIIRQGRNLTLGLLGNEDGGFYTCLYTMTSDIYGSYYLQAEPYLLALMKPLQPNIAFDHKSNLMDLPYSYYGNGQGPIFFKFALGQIIPVKCSPVYVYNEDDESVRSKYLYSLYKNSQLLNVNNDRGTFLVSGLPVGEHNFSCTVNNGFGYSEMSYPLLVIVTPRVMIAASRAYPFIGGDVTLTCITSQSSSGLDVTWKKNGVELTETSPYLKLDNLSLYDEGSYVCRQRSGQWTMAISEPYILAFSSAASQPIIFTNQNVTSIEPESSVQIFCVSSRTSSKKAAFYRNNQIVYISIDGITDDVGYITYAYQVKPVNESISGLYTCTVENILGLSETSSSIQITVANGITRGGLLCNDTCLICNVSNTKMCHTNNGTCECRLGWTGTTCSTDVDECSSKVSPCSDPNSRCVNSPGSYSCNCSFGFFRRNATSSTCEVIECDISFFGSNCTHRCNCNPEGSTCDKFTGACQCYTGWEGPKCDTDINECLKVGNLCGTLGICVNTNGGYQCVCHPGYKLNSSNLCEECDSNHYGANCITQCLCQPQNSVCNKVTGACKCTIGWEGPTCYSDINECLKGRNVCGSKVSSDACVNTNGGYYCDCPVGYHLSDLNTCEAVLSLTIVIRFPFYTPPDSHLIISSTSYRDVIRELENAINKQLRRLVKGFLIFVVQGLRRGSLIVDSNLTMFEDVNNNTAGLLTKGLTSLNWTDVTIDGAHQNATIIMSNGYSISTDADQCSLRNIIQPCPPDTFCSIDKDGVSYCQRRPTLESNDVISEKGLYIGLGIGVGVFVLVAAAVIITACVMKRRQKETT